MTSFSIIDDLADYIDEATITWRPEHAGGLFLAFAEFLRPEFDSEEIEAVDFARSFWLGDREKLEEARLEHLDTMWGRQRIYDHQESSDTRRQAINRIALCTLINHEPLSDMDCDLLHTLCSEIGISGVDVARIIEGSVPGFKVEKKY